mgnify:CR=1 FL=1
MLLFPVLSACMSGGGFGRAARPASGGGFGRGGARPAAARKPPPAAARKPPPSLEAVAARFRNRLPASECEPCACGSGLGYAACCQPYHAGGASPESPERCLQARFSAFAYRLPLPLIATTHRENRDYREDRVAWARALDREGMFDGFEFVRLDIGAREGGGGGGGGEGGGGGGGEEECETGARGDSDEAAPLLHRTAPVNGVSSRLQP